MPEHLRQMIKTDINIPNLVSILSVIVILAVGWTRLEERLESNRDDIVDLKEAHNARLVALETAKKEQIQRELDTARVLAEMRTDIRYLRQSFDRQNEMRR